MNDEHSRIAHRKAVFEALVRHLEQTFLMGDAKPPQQLISEEVVYKDRVVSQEALREVLDHLNFKMRKEEASLREFSVSRKKKVKDGKQGA